MTRKKRLRHQVRKKARLNRLALAGFATVALGSTGFTRVYADSTTQVESSTPPSVLETREEPREEETPTTGAEETSEPSVVSGGTDPSTLSTPKEEKPILVVETEAITPEIKSITEKDTDGRVPDFFTASYEIEFEPFTKPFILKSTVTNQETGEKQVASKVVERQAQYDYTNVRWIDRGVMDPATPPILTGYSYKAFVGGSFAKAGTTRLDVAVFDLENKPLALSETSKAKLAALPTADKKVEDLLFSEGNLLAVEVSKHQVDQGEDIVYTLIFDNAVLPSNSYAKVYDNLKISNPGAQFRPRPHQGSLSTHVTEDSKRFLNISLSFTADKAGVFKPTLEEGSGYSITYYEKGVEKTREAGVMSEANRSKFAELAPTVTISDKQMQYVSNSIKPTAAALVSAGGTVSPIVAGDLSRDEETGATYVSFTKAKVGDKLRLAYKLEDDQVNAQNVLVMTFGQVSPVERTVTRDGAEKAMLLQKVFPGAFEWSNIHLHDQISKELKNDEQFVEINITEHMRGLYQVGNDLPLGYILVENPTFVPTLTLSNLPEVLYNGERKSVQADLTGVPASQVEGIRLTYTVGESEQFLDLFPHKERYVASLYALTSELGVYRLTEAAVKFKDGSIIRLPQLPDSSFEYSGEKREVNGVLLSGDDVAKVKDIQRSPIFSNLGRLPKKLLNRNLSVEKILPVDAEGNSVNLTNADISVTTFWNNPDRINPDETGVEYFYYLPLSGVLTKLQPVRDDTYSNSRLVVNNISDVTGVFVKAFPVTADKPAGNSANYKVLANDDAMIRVELVQGDVQNIARIQTSRVTDTETLAKLPMAYLPDQVDLYDIKTIGQDGNFKQIESEATVTLPVDPRRKVSKIFYFLPETGAIEELKFDYEQQYNQVVFKVSHFSQYGVQYEKDTLAQSVSFDRDAKIKEVKQAWNRLKNLLEKASQVDAAKYTAASYQMVFETADGFDGKRSGSLPSYLKEYKELLAGTAELDVTVDSATLLKTILVYQADANNLTQALAGLTALESGAIETPGGTSTPDNTVEIPGEQTTPDNTVEIPGKQSTPDNTVNTPGKQTIPDRTVAKSDSPFAALSLGSKPVTSREFVTQTTPVSQIKEARKGSVTTQAQLPQTGADSSVYLGGLGFFGLGLLGLQLAKHRRKQV